MSLLKYTRVPIIPDVPYLLDKIFILRFQYLDSLCLRGER